MTEINIEELAKKTRNPDLLQKAPTSWHDGYTTGLEIGFVAGFRRAVKEMRDELDKAERAFEKDLSQKGQDQ